MNAVKHTSDIKGCSVIQKLYLFINVSVKHLLIISIFWPFVNLEAKKFNINKFVKKTLHKIWQTNGLNNIVLCHFSMSLGLISWRLLCFMSGIYSTFSFHFMLANYRCTARNWWQTFFLSSQHCFWPFSNKFRCFGPEWMSAL